MDNQSAEHIATQPTMNEHSRSIDICHHEVRQDYLQGKLQIGGVKTTENPSDILTKFLPAPKHQHHTKFLNLILPTPYIQNGNLISTTLPQPKIATVQPFIYPTAHQIIKCQRKRQAHQKSKNFF
jgi:hypothetical protein